jgi:hypothetical protein
MTILILSNLNILFKEPSAYELLFPLKNPYLFKSFYFTISLNSDASQTSLVKLNYKPKGILNDSTFIYQRLIFGQKGGFNNFSFGFKKNEFQINIKAQFNEILYIETSEENQIQNLDKVFGKIRDTIYPTDINGLDRSIIVEYNFDSLYRRIELSSSGKFSIYSNPITFEIGYKNFLISSEFRFITQSGDFIQYEAKNFYLSSSPKVQFLNCSNCKWFAYLFSTPKIPSPFKIKRSFNVNDKNHFSFYLSYFDDKTIIRFGYSPKLTIDGEINDEISYISQIGNVIDSIVYDKSSNYLYATRNGDTIEISNYALIYLFFNYKDTTYSRKFNFSYEIPQNIIFEVYRNFKLKNFDFYLFFGQKSLYNAYFGISTIHKFYKKTLINYGYLYNKNLFFDYHNVLINFLIPTGRFLFSFGSHITINKSEEKILNFLMKNYLVDYKPSNYLSLGINLQISYVK